MAKTKKIKEVKPIFKFVGVLKEFNYIENEDKSKNSSYELKLEDKEMESEVILKIWEGSTGRYWDNKEKRMVEVTSKINEEMKRVRDNAIGSPISYKVKGNKETEYFTSNELIEQIKKVKKGSRVKIEGNINFTMYNGRVIRNYNINSFSLDTSKEKLGFMITTPIVITEETKNLFKVSDYPTVLPVLVNAKLENGSGKGYRASNISIDGKYLFDGLLNSLKLSKENTINKANEILKTVFSNVKDKNSEYYILAITGRLKSGVVIRKPSIDDINPLEVAILQLKGDDYLKEKIDGMEEISEYFDDLVLNIVEFVDNKFCETIERNELNLSDDNTNSFQTEENPLMASIFEIQESNDEDNSEEKEKEETLEDLVNEAEKKYSDDEDKKELDEDEFPF